MDFKTIAKLARFKEIVVILMKYGFDDLVQRINIPGTQLIQRTGRTDHKVGTYERIRFILEDLGPTFVKFGQIMSLRPDLLPNPLIKELSRLQDEVPPVSFDKIQEVVEKDLSQPLQRVFSIFDVVPFAAASLSQVHKGVLREQGYIVSVKVQRPDIRRSIETDLDILAVVAERLRDRSEDLQTYDLPNLVRVIRKNLLREIDFTNEARNMKIARSQTYHSTDVYIPQVYYDYCSKRVLVTEYIDGDKLKDADQRTLESPEILARQGLKAAIEQILENGFFHADPHPGNILLSKERGLCLIDWGLVGRLTRKDRYELIDLLKSIVDKDGDAMVCTLLRIARSQKTFDKRNLERELLDLVDAYYPVPIKDLNIGNLLMAITELLGEYRLKLPANLIMMIKALVTAEGTARQIYPELNVVSEAEGLVKHLAAQRLKPEIAWRNLRTTLSNFWSTYRETPGLFLKIMDKIDRGELGLRTWHENLEGMQNTLDNISNRLAFSIIIGSLIIGSSMIITTGVSPLLFGYPALGVIGYLVSVLLGLWLIFNILRGKKY
jgi:ubiquinone biosynthesis protein